MSFDANQVNEYVAVIRRTDSSEPDTSGGRKWGGAWVFEPRLIPKKYTEMAYGSGKATFDLLPNRYNQGNGWEASAGIDSGSYVGITKLINGELQDPEWVGYITSFPSVKYKSSFDTQGQVTATRLGGILGQIPLRRFGIKKNKEGDDIIDIVEKAPQANYAIQSGDVIGNRIANPENSELASLFENNVLDCGTEDINYWTRAQLMAHVLEYSLPDGLAPITIAYLGLAQGVVDTVVKETYRLDNASLKDALDLLFTRQRGLVWDIDAFGDDWQINVRLTFDVDNKIDFDFSEISRDFVSDLSIAEDSGAQYDEIIVEGRPIVWMGTIENGTDDETGTPIYFEAGWTEDQETAYKAAEPGEKLNVQFDDVFRRWNFIDPTGGDILHTQEEGGTGAPVLFCQKLTWNFDTEEVDVNNKADTSPYLPTAKISRTTPWAIGVDELIDNRDALQTNNPIYSPPMMFNVLEDDTVDISNTTVAGENVYADDRGLAFRIRASNGNTYGLKQNDPVFDTTEAPAVYNWEANAFTFAIESTQKLRLSVIRNEDLTNNPLRKTLVIQGDWHAWACHEGAIVGVDSENNPIRTSTVGDYDKQILESNRTFLLRNDYPAAAEALAEAQVWAFREAKSGSMVFTDPSLENIFQVGVSIGEIIDKDNNSDQQNLLGQAEAVHEVNASVESISVELLLSGPKVTVNFGVPNSPSSLGNSTTTVKNASQSARATDVTEKIESIEQQMQAIPVSMAKGGASATAVDMYQIIDGNTLPPASLTGIKFESGTVAIIDDDPTIPGIRGDGMGRAKNLTTGDFVMIVHDGDAPYAPDVALLGNDFGTLVASRVSTGPSPTTYYYLGRF